MDRGGLLLRRRRERRDDRAAPADLGGRSVHLVEMTARAQQLATERREREPLAPWPAANVYRGQ